MCELALNSSRANKGIIIIRDYKGVLEMRLPITWEFTKSKGFDYMPTCIECGKLSQIAEYIFELQMTFRAVPQHGTYRIKED